MLTQRLCNLGMVVWGFGWLWITAMAHGLVHACCTQLTKSCWKHLLTKKHYITNVCKQLKFSTGCQLLLCPAPAWLIRSLATSLTHPTRDTRLFLTVHVKEWWCMCESWCYRSILPLGHAASWWYPAEFLALDLLYTAFLYSLPPWALKVVPYW